MQHPRAISRSSSVCAALTALASLFTSGCFTNSDGVDPPGDQLYYPTNLVVSPGGTALYVTNSDFDLQYNGGTVQVLDLVTIRDKAERLVKALASDAGSKACAPEGLAENAEANLYPGPCGPLDLVTGADEKLVKGSRIIGAFASDAILVSNPDKNVHQARLFVSVRGDPSVTYFEISDDSPADVGKVCESGDACTSGICTAGVCQPVAPCASGDAFCLECSQTSDTRCGTTNRVGVDESQNERGLLLPVEPIGIAASPSGEAIVTAHQTEQSASLVVNDWGTETSLKYSLTNLSLGPTEIAALPEPGAVRVSRPSDGDPLGSSGIAWEPGFVVTFRASAELDLLRYRDDREAAPARPFLTRASVAGITVNARGTDQRGIAIDDTDRKKCEDACDKTGGGASTLLSCMRTCVEIPLRLFVASRAPASLLVGDIRTRIVELDGQPTSAFEEIVINDTVPLAFGASRVKIGKVIGQDGALHSRAFVAAFDSRFVFVYDPVARRIETVIRTGRGPHGIAFDTGGEGDSLRSFLYVAHFTDSYIGVVDLDMRRPSTFGSMFLTVGTPVPPRGSN